MTGTYIPVKDRDHRYGVFHVRYFVSVPYIHTRSKDDLREFGMPSSGYKEFDTGQEHDLVKRFVTINEMLEFFLKGINVYVVDPQQTKDIYEAITEYLNFWLSNIRQTFSTNHVPLEDLQNLDKFANVVYDKAKYQFTKEIVDDAMMRAISNISLVNFDTILSEAPKVIYTNHDGSVAPGDEEVVNPYPKRDSMLEMFKAVRQRRMERNK